MNIELKKDDAKYLLSIIENKMFSVEEEIRKIEYNEYVKEEVLKFHLPMIKNELQSLKNVREELNRVVYGE